jgi:hypothetical protein
VTQIRSQRARSQCPSPLSPWIKNDAAIAARSRFSPGKRQRGRVDLDRPHQTLATDYLACQSGAVARTHANLEEPVRRIQAERLVEQRTAVRARGRRPLTRERQGNLLIGVVAIPSRG